MRVEVALPPEALELVERLVDLPLSSGTTGVVSYADSGELVAAVVFTEPLLGNTFFTIAAARNFWAQKEFFRQAFHHAFITLGSVGLTSMVRASNTKSLRLAHKLGFRLEGVMKGFEFGDVILLGMRKEECKWLHSPYQ